MGEGAAQGGIRPEADAHGARQELTNRLTNRLTDRLTGRPASLRVETVADPGDARLTPYAAIRERDLVGRHGRFIVEGEVSLRLALSPAARFSLESVLLLPERLPDLSEALAASPEPPPVLLAERAVMSAVAGFPIHRGVLALARRGPEPDPAALIPTLIPPAPARACLLGLVGLTNHDNVGGCFRNAAAFGADAVFLDPATCDPLYRKAIRVSAGAALTMPFARLGSADALLDLAQAHDLVPLAMTPGAQAEVAEADLPARALVLLGTEGPGLPIGLMARAQALRIGMAPGVDSLNVAVAGALVLHRLWMARRVRA